MNHIYVENLPAKQFFYGEIRYPFSQEKGDVGRNKRDSFREVKSLQKTTFCTQKASSDLNSAILHLTHSDPVTLANLRFSKQPDPSSL